MGETETTHSEAFYRFGFIITVKCTAVAIFEQNDAIPICSLFGTCYQQAV